MPVILWKQDTQISQRFWRLSILCQKSMHCHLPAVSDVELKTVHRDAISVAKEEIYSCLNKLPVFPCCLFLRNSVLFISTSITFTTTIIFTIISLTRLTLDPFIL